MDAYYWILEDFAENPMYRSLATTLSFLLLRSLLILPGILETARALFLAGFGTLFAVINVKEIITVLADKCQGSSDFFRYYNQLFIIFNTLSDGITRSVLLGVTVLYVSVIEVVWVLVCGWGNLEASIYSFFVLFAISLITAIGICLPLTAVTGEKILDLPRIKRAALKARYCVRKSLQAKVFVKFAAAVQPIKISFGTDYPIGRRFSRNVFGNLLENLLSMVLIFDMNGRRAH